jgi:long-chain acyl-CoA synthetase
VPRIYEKLYARVMDNLKKQPTLKQRLFQKAVDVGWSRYQRLQKRAGWHPKQLLWPLLKKLVASKINERLGGRLRYAICGGAAMPPQIARTFLGLGVPVYQGYGLTESSPVICVNRPWDNIPESIGMAAPGVEVKIGDQHELLARGPNIMLGYWRNEKATRDTIDSEGWLHSGDQVRVDEGGHYFITGRIKDIIVLGNGEKVPPADMEMAIAMDPLFEQVMILGEGRAFLSTILVLNPDHWRQFAKTLDVDPDDPATLKEKFVEKSVLARVSHQLSAFPGFAQIRRAFLTLEPWTIDNGLLTPTMKVKRPQMMKRFHEQIESLYEERSA